MKYLIFYPFFLYLLINVGTCFAQTDTVKVYLGVEQMPEFPGGNESLQMHFNNAIRIDRSSNNHNLNVAFVKLLIKYDGSVSASRISYYGFNDREKFEKAIKSMPKWKPGKHNGEPVNVIVDLNSIRIDYDSCKIVIDSVNLVESEVSKLYWSNIRNILSEFFNIRREHSIFLDEAIDKMNMGNYPAAIKKLNNALVANPFDVAVIQTRSAAYFSLENAKCGCADRKYATYLDGFNDTAFVTSTLGLCPDNFFFHREKFLSDGYMVPDRIYKDDQLDSTLIPPAFPGGSDSLYKFISENFRLDSVKDYEPYHFMIIIKFTITKEGNVEKPIALNYKHDPIAWEGVRLTKLMPKWRPAMRNNEPVESEYLFPVINFKFRKSIYIPENNVAYNRGVLLLSDEKYSEAFEQFNIALANDSMDLDARHNRGICHWYMSDKNHACADWSMTTYYQGGVDLKLINKYCDSLIIIGVDSVSTSFFRTSKVDTTQKAFSFPVYPGGKEMMNQFFLENAHSEELKKILFKNVYIRCIVTKEGRAVFPSIVYSNGKDVDDELLALVRRMPTMTPATLNDIPIDIIYWIHLNETEKTNK